MSITYTAAIDLMFGRSKAAIDANKSIVGNPDPVVRYIGRDEETVPPAGRYLVEVQSFGSGNRQSGFGVTKLMYTATGTLYLRIFAPQAGANNYRKGQLFADALKNSFRGKLITGAVWYRNARVQELPPEKGAYRFNVLVDYTYDELQ